MNSIIEILEFIKSHPSCNSESLDYHIVLDLYDSGYVSGSNASTYDCLSFDRLRLTISGNEYLKSLKNPDAEPNHTAYKAIEKSNQWSSNPILIIAIVVIGGFILTCAIYVFKTHTGIPLN